MNNHISIIIKGKTISFAFFVFTLVSLYSCVQDKLCVTKDKSCGVKDKACGTKEESGGTKE